MPDQPHSVPPPRAQHYARWPRAFHWWTVLFIALLVPIGLIMTDRGERNIWDATTNNLYSTHKLLGFTLLWIIVARLAYRLRHGAPGDEPSLEPWQKLVSHLTHWALYGMLLLVPMLGWIGVSKYPALDLFGPLKLPAIASASKPDAEKILELHGLAAKVLAALIAMHVGAALFHYFIRKDGVLQRMLPWAGRRGE